ncbi:uncharacterized protein I303_100815 [Kwoniella dejecticola CBS 10117]|uniref:Uncharacterized protein n=1 Tax=Kwoniella dejecticola CBS 10117 TaxID=1296121 RepID=A0A1A6AFZ5_9TREE|nr:uncharacterized protein I303_00817 [Kwoniella dejecticola CBS 10117]OBR88997.1 hypothetical protein I303_00817 [Kwoniella dejecticola CBS 10117]
MSESATPSNPPAADNEESPRPIPSSTELTPAPAESTPHSPGEASAEPVIDPELMDLPAPPHHSNTKASKSNGTSKPDQSTSPSAIDTEYNSMGIRESIASAPNPRPAEFPPPDQLNENLSLDLEAIAQIAAENDDMPGSPTAKMMRAIAPQSAIMTNPEWAPPPHNASVNLFIGRALLSNGNDNWPLKPNDIVNWIRKHYPAEWDGDEGRCSAHRVRTYLARKGADMYYEKLNQGCINGWRIRANHLWRFENGGFQGRGMKQEESIANAEKEREALANAARKEAAAAALAAGHPGIKVSMSNPGVNDGSHILPPAKKLRITNAAAAAAAAAATSSITANHTPNKTPAARKRNPKKSLPATQATPTTQIDQSYIHAQPQDNHGDLSSYTNQNYYTQQTHQPQPNLYGLDNTHQQQQQTQTQPQAGPSTLPGQSQHQQQQGNLDPTLSNNDVTLVHMDGNGTGNGTGTGHATQSDVDMNMVQQAMQAAATASQMDDLDMGIQLPIEMQMHSNGHEGDDDDGRFGFGVGVGGENGQTYGQDSTYGYTG